ncbi:MAG TPA: hypothetical protein VEI52_05465, partial [Terriglobales bacterium]|nr:hypothetical protein [Terriglobales bacterium]
NREKEVTEASYLDPSSGGRQYKEEEKNPTLFPLGPGQRSFRGGGACTGRTRKISDHLRRQYFFLP